eukprot:TRINITY_DN7522_c0_g1_i1.p1 TRINITY_DN7522_c0_g1~~TRINITY_DN7522_c0_g1_i1.p1  ORF type:complete len:391 (+),score=59.49 TRINITY_DN7522_c0_g1_i1:84-1256(+)
MAFGGPRTSWKSLHALNQEREAIENIIEREAVASECDNLRLRVENKELTQRLELVMVFWRKSAGVAKVPGTTMFEEGYQSSASCSSSCSFSSSEGDIMGMASLDKVPEMTICQDPLVYPLETSCPPSITSSPPPKPHLPEISIDNCFGWSLDVPGVHVEQVTSMPNSPEPETGYQFLDPTQFIGKGLTSQLNTPRTPRSCTPVLTEREMIAFIFWHWDADCDGVLSEDETRRFLQSSNCTDSWEAVCQELGVSIDSGLRPKDFLRLMYLNSIDARLGLLRSIYEEAKKLSKEQNFEDSHNEHKLITIFNKWDQSIPHGYWSHDDAVACQRITQPNEPLPSCEDWGNLCNSLGASSLGLASPDLATLYSMGNTNQLELDFEATGAALLTQS